MRRETQNILLILLGGALLKISFSGLYLRYVQKSLLPWLIVAGVVMIGLAVFAIIQDMRGAQQHDHGHSSRSPWMLLLPVLAVFLISPPALGTDVVNSGQSNQAAKSKAFADLPGGDVIPLSMTEFVTRTAWDDSGSLDNRTVRLTGFLVRTEGVTYVARLTIACCAADAQPLKAKLAGMEFAGLPDEQWVEVTGRVVPKSATRETSYVATFTVSDIKPISAPVEPYES